jgi:hypothetical protein
MAVPTSTKAAAREIGCSVSTVRRWLREGAPAVRHGGVGRGKSAVVDPDVLRRWRAGETASPESALAAVARGIENAYRRAPEGHRQPAWAELGLGHRQSAVLLIEVYREIVRTIEGRYPEALPEEMARLASLVSVGK